METQIPEKVYIKRIPRKVLKIHIQTLEDIKSLREDYACKDLSDPQILTRAFSRLNSKIEVNLYKALFNMSKLRKQFGQTDVNLGIESMSSYLRKAFKKADRIKSNEDMLLAKRLGFSQASSLRLHTYIQSQEFWDNIIKFSAENNNNFILFFARSRQAQIRFQIEEIGKIIK